MSEYQKHICIGLVAHVDAGKTTLSEALLYHTGQIRSLGRVDHKDAFLDTNAMERERGITIFSKQARLHTGNLDITIVDTPGHVDFSAEMERTLQVLDYAVLVISGSEGVQVHTRTLWRLLQHYDIPVFLFVNKMDLDGSNREQVFTQLKEELSSDCVDFSAVDLSEALVNEDYAFSSSVYDGEWLEEIATCGEEMMEQLLETDTIDAERVRLAVSERRLFPVVFGSALKMQYIDQLLSVISSLSENILYPEAFGARVYKIGRDSQGNRLTYAKITGGELKVKESVMIGDSLEKPDQIRYYNGDQYTSSETATAGDIVAVTGLTGTFPGQGLGYMKDNRTPVLEPVLNYRMILPDEVSPLDFYGKMKQLQEEDPLLYVKWYEDSSEIHVQLMGRIQLEILTRQIKDRFGIDVTFGQGRIVYKETIAKPVEGIGHFEPLRHYAEVHLLLEPGAPGSGIQAETACSTDILATNWQRLIITHILERQHRGVLTGSALTDVKITILTGRAHLKHTEGGDFRQAVYRAIRQGLKSTECILLEPIYSFMLEVPIENIGRAMNDIGQMGGHFEGPVFSSTSLGERAAIKGTVPVAALGDYVVEVNAYTKGTGLLTYEPDGYAPCHNQEEVIESIGYDSEADTRNPTGSVFCAHGAGFIVPWDLVPSYMHLDRVYWPDEEDSLEYSDREISYAPPTRSTFSEKEAWDVEDELQELYSRERGKKYEGAGRKEGWKTRPQKTMASVSHQKIDKHGNPIYPAKDTRKDCLIVDGYNIIYGWEELRSLFIENMDAGRTALLDKLSNYQGYTDHRVIVVFDAYRTRISPERLHKYQNLEVIFTKADETADAYIEKVVHDQNGKYRFTVATSDGLEQLTVMGLGASRMSVRLLREELDRVSRDGYSDYLDKQKNR